MNEKGRNRNPQVEWNRMYAWWGVGEVPRRMERWERGEEKESWLGEVAGYRGKWKEVMTFMPCLAVT